MRIINKRPEARNFNFDPAGFVMARSPALPFTVFEDWVEMATPAHACQSHEKLRALVGQPFVKEALFIASPSLYQRACDWLGGARLEDADKVEAALWRYVTRMCCRPTPFGLFAGVSTGSIGETTRFLPSDPLTYQRHARLDSGYVYLLADVVAADPSIRPSIKFYANSSVYEYGKTLRYVEWDSNGGLRRYRLSEIHRTDYLQAVLERASGGSTLRELSDLLRDLEGVDSNIADEYLASLISARLLIAETEPPITGIEPFDFLVERLERTAPSASVTSKLRGVRDKLSALNSQPVGCDLDSYRQIAADLGGLSAPANLGNLFQVDLHQPETDVVLSRDLCNELLACAELLYGIRDQESDPLTRFKESFSNRYERREVPLVEVLDEESGIGFGPRHGSRSSLLDGLKVGNGDRGVPPLAVTKWDALLLERVVSAAKQGSVEVQLGPEDLKTHHKATRAPPNAFYAFVSLFTGESGQTELLLKMIGGASGAELMGRFCHGDPKLTSEVRSLLAAEAGLCSDAILAEIVHLPHGRIGNLTARPLLRDYEIEYLGVSGARSEGVIPVSDLLLSISEENELILRSKRYQARVIPRLTSAHNFRQVGNLGTYQFLCQLQAGTSNFGFQWPPVFTSLGFLPRVRLGNIILSLAKWRVPGETVARARKMTKGHRAFCKELQSIASLPRFVSMVEGEALLPVDFENDLSLDNLSRAVSKEADIVFEEIYARSSRLHTPSRENAHCNEIIIPFMKRTSQTGPSVRSAVGASRSGEPVRRTFEPGTEWLYVKVYCGIRTANQILISEIGPLVREMVRNKTIDSWFFIRYRDPDDHLRVRFHGLRNTLVSVVMPALQSSLDPWLAESRVWKVEFDTYQREIERYGGPQGFVQCEKLFCRDSEAVIRLLEKLSSEDLLGRSWECAALGIDALLDDFNLKVDQRLHFATGMASGLAAEFAPSKEHGIKLGMKYRALRTRLSEILDATGTDPVLLFARDVFAERSSAFAPTIAELGALDGKEMLSVSLQQLAISIIHMFVNRLMASEQRAHEFVLYDFLRRHYESAVVRSGLTRQRKAWAADSEEMADENSA